MGQVYDQNICGYFNYQSMLENQFHDFFLEQRHLLKCLIQQEMIICSWGMTFKQGLTFSQK